MLSYLTVCSVIECIKRVEEITGKTIPFYKEDLLNKEAVQKVFSKVQ
jgi:UDP-glucose 4-epimerase